MDREEFKRAQSDVVWSLPRILLVWGLIMFGLYGLGFIATGGNLAIYQFWAPKQAAAEREVFKQGQSHIEGTISYLSRLEREYKDADTLAKREALRSLIIEESRKVDFSLLPADLQAFISSVR